MRIASDWFLNTRSPFPSSLTFEFHWNIQFYVFCIFFFFFSHEQRARLTVKTNFHGDAVIPDWFLNKYKILIFNPHWNDWSHLLCFFLQARRWLLVSFHRDANFSNRFWTQKLYFIFIKMIKVKLFSVILFVQAKSWLWDFLKQTKQLPVIAVFWHWTLFEM